MRTALLAVVVAAAVGPSCASCPGAPAGGVAEGEGEGNAAEGEGNGAEGEGNAAEGEGEGEGNAAEGEGEGEGNAGEGEGEGEGQASGQLGDPCRNDSFCAAPLVCGFDGATGVLRTACVNPPAGGASEGTPCGAPGECAFHLCENGLCSRPCAVDVNCAITQICQTSSVTVDGVGGVVDVCQPNGGLPPTPCDEDAVCASTGRLCNDLVSQGVGQPLALQCGFPGAGGGQLGAACGTNSLENRTQCNTGLCDGAVAGQCVRACNSDDDCGGGGFICTGSGFSNVPAELCGEFCTNEAACGAGRSCELRRNLVENLLDQICAPNLGTQPPGTSVPAPNNDCEAGIIITQGPNRFCSALCSVAADCAAFPGITRCGPVNFPKPNGGGATQSVDVCLAP